VIKSNYRATTNNHKDAVTTLYTVRVINYLFIYYYYLILIHGVQDKKEQKQHNKAGQRKNSARKSQRHTSQKGIHTMNKMIYTVNHKKT